MRHSNPRIRFHESNKDNYAKIFSNDARINRILELIQADQIPSTATQNYRDSRQKTESTLQAIIEKHEQFRNSQERTQSDINNLIAEQNNILKQFSYYNL